MERKLKFDWHPSPRRPRSPSSVSSSSAFSSRLTSFSSDAGDSIVYAEDCFEAEKRESGVYSKEAISGGYGGHAALQFVVPTTRFAWWRWRRKPRYHLPNVPEEHCLETHSGVLRRFPLRELQVATDNFSQKNQLGRGNFGIVYKGQLADGSLVAVKRLKDPHIGSESQFQTELNVFSLSLHKNLLILQGFCMTPTERLLVYPYMANRSLAHQLRGRSISETPLDWPTRRRIALGSARGLSYLHDHCGPKFLYNGRYSEKNDVFSYGIMLLELITGKRTFDLHRLANDYDESLLDWMIGLLEEKRLDMLVDPELQDNYIEAEVELTVQLAILCSQGSQMGRPTMSEVVRILEGEDLTERWEEWKKENERRLDPELGTYQTWIVDSTENLDSMELSSPR